MLLSALRRGAIRATAVITGGAALSEEYPVFTREEISKRDGKRGATWVTYKDQVYDITEFVNAHPGGAQKIKLAAGASVEPFWRIYKQHLDPAVDIQEILAPMRIGTLSAEDFAKETSMTKEKKEDDRTTVTATMQCSGNRRGHMNQYGKTSGTAWGSGAASTAEWAGVPLRLVVADLLFKDKSAPLTAAKALGAKHVIFEAKDDMQASVPVEKALSELGDCILAYEMNGQPIPRDHGGPLRAIVPGYAGVRNVKWVQRVKLSSDEAEGAWQRGMNYKAMPSHWRTKQDLQGVDFASLPSIHELPVQCAFSSPAPGDSLPSDEESIEAKGWALGSAGRSIHRVEVSADGGETWVEADLEEGLDQPYGRAWAWTTWSAEVPVGSGPVELVARAHDLGGGAMPRTPADVWNIRGLNNNSWPVARLERS